MLDALTIEQMGIPAAVIGTDKLVATTGHGMARAHGVPHFSFAIIEHPIEQIRDESEIIRRAEAAAPQVEAILMGEN